MTPTTPPSTPSLRSCERPAPLGTAEPSVRPTASETLISVVLPVYNESAVLRRLLEAVAASLDRTGCRHEIVFVNDGSSDGSEQILDELAYNDPRVKVLHCSRNFGHAAAVHAGISHATGDAVIVMDSDMQDDPNSLGEFVKHWRAGYDVVYAVRRKRKETLIKRGLFSAFYRLLKLVSELPIPTDAGNFGLIDRRVANVIAALPESDRYFPGLRCWVGFQQLGIPVERGPRHDDQPRVSFAGLVRLAKAAIFSFSSAPLTLFYAIAVASLLVCGFGSAVALVKTWTGNPVPVWNGTLIIASFFGAMNALGISVLGEYVLRIYAQVRGRPPYLIARTRNFTRSQPESLHPTRSPATEPSFATSLENSLETELRELEQQYSAFRPPTFPPTRAIQDTHV